MPYKTFNQWLFDGNPKSEIPKPNTEKNIPDLLKYNSPIHHTYLISLFVNHGRINHYLDKYFNNMGLRYLEREELFRFAKKLVQDFKIQRSSLPYIKYAGRKTKLYDSLRRKFPMLKTYDVSFMCDVIDKSPEKEMVYASFGIDDPQVSKQKKSKQKNEVEKTDKITVKEFIEKNFNVVKIQK
jgi:hypothetical protein